jgi:hypothetical protein
VPCLRKKKGYHVQLLIYRHSGDGYSDVTMPVTTMKHSGNMRSDDTMLVLLRIIVPTSVDDVITPIAIDE